MEYREFKNYKRPYVVVWYEGLNTADDPMAMKKILGDYDSYDQAEEAAIYMTLSTNDNKAIEQGMHRNTFLIAVNTATKHGKQLYKLFRKKFHEKQD